MQVTARTKMMIKTMSYILMGLSLATVSSILMAETALTETTLRQENDGLHRLTADVVQDVVQDGKQPVSVQQQLHADKAKKQQKKRQQNHLDATVTADYIELKKVNELLQLNNSSTLLERAPIAKEEQIRLEKIDINGLEVNNVKADVTIQVTH